EWPRSSHHPSHTNWRKSSHSGGEGGQRVELAGLGRGVGVRDGKDPDGPVLHITRRAPAVVAGPVTGQSG
ncbi:DUF397 domain-containing protein, partial [Spirillospora sp. NPDC047279]|uniref:DUF397 domain-containing protein n=1 Tax=Spirillospora sp. NPDC047279 TaxID=3155478 RepID=UPI003405C420